MPTITNGKVLLEFKTFLCQNGGLKGRLGPNFLKGEQSQRGDLMIILKRGNLLKKGPLLKEGGFW